MGSSSGGGASGTSDYPAYVKRIHGNWLADVDYTETTPAHIITDGYSMVELMNTAFLADTPYTDADRVSQAVAYDPDTYLTAVQTQFDAFETAAEAISESTDWATYIDAVIAKLDDGTTFPTNTFIANLATAMSNAVTAINTTIASAPITAVVDGYETSQIARFKRSTARFSASLAEVNAVQTTSFGMGLALMESEFNNDVNKFEADLKLQTFKDLLVPSITYHLEAEMRRAGIRDQYISVCVGAITDLLKVKMASLSGTVSTLAEINRIAIVAKKEENDYNLSLDIKESLWDIELYKHGANLLASAVGGVVSTGENKEPSALQSGLSGGFSGGSIGASVGGAPGAGIGFGIGFSLSYIAEALN